MSTATKTVATKQAGLVDFIRSDTVRAKIGAVAASMIKPEKLVSASLNAINNNPTLLKCDRLTVLAAIMQAARLGLECDGGVLGQGYLVPFYSNAKQRYECQFIPGYRGLIKLARNSGDVADVRAECVYEGDTFRMSLGLKQDITHEPGEHFGDDAKLEKVYAVARFRDGELKFVVLNRRQVEKRRAMSQSKDKQGNLVGPWKDWQSEMWKKTAVRQLSKMLPLSVEMQSQIESCDVAETGGAFDVDDEPRLEHDTTTDTIDQWGQWSEELKACDSVSAAQACYDRWFGPDATVQFDTQQNTEAVRWRDLRIEEIRSTRGPGSNKQS